MYGLSCRWSLREAPPDAAEKLREYVVKNSLDRFSGLAEMHFKTWRMVPGEWFEGTYVWESAEARDAFLAAFQEQAPNGPVTGIVGSPPVLFEPFEVVGIAEGEAGFLTGPGPGTP
jgi:hypothetical protein